MTMTMYSGDQFHNWLKHER